MAQRVRGYVDIDSEVRAMWWQSEYWSTYVDNESGSAMW